MYIFYEIDIENLKSSFDINFYNDQILTKNNDENFNNKFDHKKSNLKILFGDKTCFEKINLN